jgi:hypothetical protein
MNEALNALDRIEQLLMRYDPNQPRDEEGKWVDGASVITITQPKGVGKLTKAADGKWDITLNGVKGPSNNYYTTDQVKKIVGTSIKAGHKVEAQ